MINALLNPTSNPWASEQNLLQDLIDESIQICGVDMNYAIREKVGRDYLFGEAPMSEFKESIQIEMEIVEIHKFNGDGDVYSLFGMQHNDIAKFRVSQRRFKTEFADTTLTMPREGDLIFLPLNNSLWEIRKVHNDDNFQRFGVSYSYVLDCNLFQYSFETIETGNDEIDVFGTQFADSVETTDVFGNLYKTLTVKIDNFNEESNMLEKEASGIREFDPSKPFDQY